MNASPTDIEPDSTQPSPTDATQDDHVIAEPHDPNATDVAVRALARELGRSLQLTRGSALALTRLQLALKSGDRRAAMAAMDRLHALDTEMERIAARLPAASDQDPDGAEWNAIVRHLGDQKAALAFEKLALVSQISGPDLVSAGKPLSASDVFPSTVPAADDAAYEAPVEECETPVEPSIETAPRQSWNPSEQRALGLLFAVLVFGALVWAGWLAMTGT